jgi:hypothetical protein
MGRHRFCNCYSSRLVRHAQMARKLCYKTELSWYFALAGLLALGIALLTVSWQSWRQQRKIC